jgi:hypothetical protein
MGKALKIYFSEEDAQDMQESFHKEEGQLWNTWSAIDSKGNTVQIELWLGNEDDIKKSIVVGEESN